MSNPYRRERRARRDALAESMRIPEIEESEDVMGRMYRAEGERRWYDTKDDALRAASLKAALDGRKS